jgi:hypothetical protein
MTIAFDVDDTLLIPAVATGLDRDVPNYDNIAILRWFQAQGHTVWVWSGGGADYARMWGEKLGLNADAYYGKAASGRPIAGATAPYQPDICFDDCIVDLAKVNVRVQRLNNQRKRL